ncbi:universal stress protein [Chryseotalea sanaruensis]|uniref:Universal stress protein n=1 Tax=Chryseotalea sanaruensis TaxID=2482724 RepID=A0A401U6A5_9BACT|nr:universal stress protein [Chryseotalea sanaruensis]GCC50417.1 universal stress protein [Chryseotalea sanaruensis]
MKKIVVPCDFSDPSIEAFKFAVKLAKKSEGKVIVVHVIDLPIFYESTFGMQPYTFDPSFIKELEKYAKEKFESLKSTYGEGHRDLLFVNPFGAVTPMLQQEIDLQKPDIVVMGTHGVSGLKEYLVGSNTEKIVRHAHVPVVAVRTCIPIEKIKNIVFATTLDLNQTALIKKVKELQSFFSAMLHVIVINTPEDFKRDKDLQEALENYVQHYHLEHYTLNKRTDINEMEGILSFAKEVKADLIAMATHGRRGLFHLLTGSIAEDVVNHGTAPVWTCSLRER